MRTFSVPILSVRLKIVQNLFWIGDSGNSPQALGGAFPAQSGANDRLNIENALHLPKARKIALYSDDQNRRKWRKMGKMAEMKENARNGEKELAGWKIYAHSFAVPRTEGIYPMKTITIKSAPKGEYVRLKESGPVYVRGDYNREAKRYSLTKFDDVNFERLVKGTAICFVGFEF